MKTQTKVMVGGGVGALLLWLLWRCKKGAVVEDFAPEDFVEEAPPLDSMQEQGDGPGYIDPVLRPATYGPITPPAVKSRTVAAMRTTGSVMTCPANYALQGGVCVPIE